MAICPNCHEENPDKFRLCGFCGTPLREETIAPQEVRKTVTVLFCDLKGSTALGERLDPETLREVMNRYFEEMKRSIERHGGSIEKFIGDAVMAVFGLPTAHEDDALRAVRAAWDMRAALTDLNVELDHRLGVTLANRTGIATGEVVANQAHGGQRLATGDTVNVAARLEQAAPQNEILIGEPTYLLVREAVEAEAVEPLDLKGKSEAVAAHRVRSVRTPGMLERRTDAPLVGREAELGALHEALLGCVASSRVRALTLIAQPGVGKSRLLREFVGGLGPEATVLRGGCLSYGEGITFWPLAEAIRGWVGIEEGAPAALALERLAAALPDAGVCERIASMIDLTTDTFPLDELFWAVGELLRRAAGGGCAVVLLEDLHWAEQTFLDLLRRLVENPAGGPVLIVATARPELLERHPDWGDGTGHGRVRIEPLPPELAVAVAENALGASLDPAVRRRIAETSEGNPLFVEQMLSMLIDRGLLVHSGDRFIATADLGAIEMPTTIQALLSARVDRLEPEERAVIEPGAVIGRSFYRDAVERMVETSAADVDAQIGALIRREYIERERAMLTFGDSFRFGHALIRDAVYNGLLKRRRADMHERFGDWLLRMVGERLAEYDEIIGHHLEQAHRYRAELGEVDAATAELGRRASGLLATAGRRALARGDGPSAAGLLRRARGALAADDPGRLDLVFDLTEALVDSGLLDEAGGMLEESERLAASLGDPLRTAESRLARLVVRFSAGEDWYDDTARAEIEQAIALFSQHGHEIGVARGWRLLGDVHGAACRYAQAEHAVEETITHARAAGNLLVERRNLAPLSFIALAGPAPVPQALERCREVFERAAGDRRTQGTILCALSQLQAMAGRFDEARESYRTARALLGEVGAVTLAASVSLNSGPVEMLAGDPAAAEAELRPDAETLTEMGERYLLPCVLGHLGLALLAQNRMDEADVVAANCRDMAAADDIEAQSIWRRVRAGVLGASGMTGPAIELGLEAVSVTDQSDGKALRGDALADLAALLADAGRDREATQVAQAALALYRAKASRASIERLYDRRLLKPEPASAV